MAFMVCSVLPQREMSVWEFRAWLRQFDADRDGGISREELQRAMRSLHAWSAWRKARDGMRESDTNKNGLIDVKGQEFDRLVGFAQRSLHMKIYACD